MDKLNKEDLHKVSQFSIFKSLCASEFESALQGAAVKNVKHREVIYKLGDSADCFCVILEGAVKLIRPTPKGSDVIMFVASVGDVVGALLMNPNFSVPFPVQVKAIGPTKIICIPRSTYNNFWTKNSNLMTMLNSILFQRMNFIQDEKTMQSAPLKSRISSLLLKHIDWEFETPNQCLKKTEFTTFNKINDKQLTTFNEKSVMNSVMSSALNSTFNFEFNSNVDSVFNKSDLKNNQNYILKVSLTRQEIADYLGVAVESVIRIMSDWNQSGVIQNKGNYLEILKIKELQC